VDSGTFPDGGDATIETERGIVEDVVVVEVVVVGAMTLTVALETDI